LIYNDSLGGARRVDFAVSPSTGLADRALDGALCLRSLALGVDALTGAALTGERAWQAARVQNGVAAVQRTGDLHGKPTILLQGQADCLLPVNNAARAYFAKSNHAQTAPHVRYYEIANAQHLDVLMSVPAFKLDALFVPTQPYFMQAMDLIYGHLKDGAPLPPSQLVHTTPRGGTPGTANPIGPQNVPPISNTPEGNLSTLRSADSTLLE
jgi:hydroxybutyrate-dimer hydrolase